MDFSSWARPNFMKIAPLMRAIYAHNGKSRTKIHPFLVHTGQHYDLNMSNSFFKDLSSRKSDVYLGVGSGTHAEQTGKTLIEFMDPLGYLDFLNLMMHSKFVITDSGGIQEETTVLGLPCLTLRDTTERPITISKGTNVLVWNDTQKIINEAFEILSGRGEKANFLEPWDGKASKSVVQVLVNYYEK